MSANRILCSSLTNVEMRPCIDNRGLLATLRASVQTLGLKSKQMSSPYSYYKAANYLRRKKCSVLYHETVF